MSVWIVKERCRREKEWPGFGQNVLGINTHQLYSPPVRMERLLEESAEESLIAFSRELLDSVSARDGPPGRESTERTQNNSHNRHQIGETTEVASTGDEDEGEEEMKGEGGNKRNRS
jgi:hypothetical protein